MLMDHFHKGGCKNAPYLVQILEKLGDNQRSAGGALDTSITPKENKQKRVDLKTTNSFPFWAQ